MSSIPARSYGPITQDVRDRAVAAVLAAISGGTSLWAASTAVSRQLDVHRNSVINWVEASGDLDARRKAADSERRAAQQRALGELVDGDHEQLNR